MASRAWSSRRETTALISPLRASTLAMALSSSSAVLTAPFRTSPASPSPSSLANSSTFMVVLLASAAPAMRGRGISCAMLELPA
jgi:hypothetical protein